MYTVESEGGEDSAGRGKTRKKSQAGSPGQGARSFRTFIYKGTGWPLAGKQPQTITYKNKTGCREGQSLAWQPRGTDKCTVTYTHTRTHRYDHTCTYTHTAALTHGHPHVRSCAHLPIHMCMYAHSALTHMHSHTCLHAHTHTLTYTQVLISGSWLQFWRFKPPKATCLH